MRFSLVLIAAAFVLASAEEARLLGLHEDQLGSSEVRKFPGQTDDERDNPVSLRAIFLSNANRLPWI